VIDGVTRVPGDGCAHDVPWYVAALSDALSIALEDTDTDLRLILESSIRRVTDMHRHTCDIENPLTPAAQVTIGRVNGDQFEWLVLGDCTFAYQLVGAEPVAICDDRVDHLPNPPEPVVIDGVRRYPLEYVAQVRNRAGGFWVASTDPKAAHEALVGVFPLINLEAVALMSDGLTRIVERYGWSWGYSLELATQSGITALIDAVRSAELSDPRLDSRGKRHDDATGVLIEFP
jgi:hypothetical protein